jgi:hypothetical protein
MRRTNYIYLGFTELLRSQFIDVNANKKIVTNEKFKKVLYTSILIKCEG